MSMLEPEQLQHNSVIIAVSKHFGRKYNTNIPKGLYDISQMNVWLITGGKLATVKRFER